MKTKNREHRKMVDALLIRTNHWIEILCEDEVRGNTFFRAKISQLKDDEDAVVIKLKHKRKFDPKKGKWMLPQGKEKKDFLVVTMKTSMSVACLGSCIHLALIEQRALILPQKLRMELPNKPFEFWENNKAA